jgi:two-component system CitB family response regulator
VVSDDDDICLSLRDRLLSMGFDVVTEKNAHSALSRISLEADQSPIRGVLLDFRVPVVDGSPILRELRDRHPDISVVVMLAVTDTAQLIEARELGVRTYLMKPFNCVRDWERIYWIFYNT